MPALFQLLISLDTSAFRALNSLAGRNGALDWIVRAGADDHIIPVTLAILTIATIVIASGHAGRDRALRSVICALGATFLSAAVLYGLNVTFFRPRPFTTQAVHFLFYHNTDSSFPSNAATLAFALAFGVFLYWRRLGAVMLVLAFLLCLARIVAGVHYPLDVIAGAALAGGSALVLKAAEPLYAPAARWLNAGIDRLLASWKQPASARVGGKDSR